MFIFAFVAHMIAISAMWVGGGLIACTGIIIGCMTGFSG